MPNLYMLCGVSGSGKSTFIKNEIDDRENFVILSTDDHIELAARLQNKTYDEIFATFIDTATKQMNNDVKYAIQTGLDCFWDQTNLTVSSRRKKLAQFSGKNYRKIAVVFAIPPVEILKKRLTSRPGKTIPWAIIEQQIANFKVPTFDEGFDEIWNINNAKDN